MKFDRLKYAASIPKGTQAFLVAGLALITLLPARLQAAIHSEIGTYPGWWSTYGVLNTGTSDDSSAATVGHANTIAVAAVAELDNDLAQFGGAGPALDNLANTIITSGAASDPAAINLGQLKILTQPFYDRLLTLGYRGPPLSTGTYPWATSGHQDNDSTAANLGKLKKLFNFDVNHSTYKTGIPDWWLRRYGVSPTTSGTSSVPWSVGQLTYRQAYQQALNPTDFYDGASASLTVVSGSNRTGPPGGFVSFPLVISVSDSNGNPMTGAPVAFSVPADGSSLQTSCTGHAITSVTVLTDGDGRAQVFYKLPNVGGTIGFITVVAGTAKKTVNEYSGGSGTYYPSPFAPSEVVGSMNADGSETVTWQNNDPLDPVYVYQEVASGSWRCTGTLAQGTTTYPVPKSLVGTVEIGNRFSPGGSTGSPPGGGTWRATSTNGPRPGYGGYDGRPPMAPGRPAFVPIPVQQYATIDMSSAVQGSSNVTAVTADDKGNAAFGFVSGTDAAGHATEYSVYRWHNGSTNLLKTIPLQASPGSGSPKIGAIDMNGNIYMKGGPGGGGNVNILTQTVAPTDLEKAAMDSINQRYRNGDKKALLEEAAIRPEISVPDLRMTAFNKSTDPEGAELARVTLSRVRGVEDYLKGKIDGQSGKRTEYAIEEMGNQMETLAIVRTNKAIRIIASNLFDDIDPGYAGSDYGIASPKFAATIILDHMRFPGAPPPMDGTNGTDDQHIAAWRAWWLKNKSKFSDSSPYMGKNYPR